MQANLQLSDDDFILADHLLRWSLEQQGLTYRHGWDPPTHRALSMDIGQRLYRLSLSKRLELIIDEHTH